MTEQNWEDDLGKCITVFLNGEGIPDLDSRGMRVVDDSFLMAFNAHYEDIQVTLPDPEYGPEWKVVVDTTTGEVGGNEKPIAASGQLSLTARSLVVLQRVG